MPVARGYRVAVVALLAAAALALSGCWATVYRDPGNGDRNITLTKDFSHRLIWSCTDAVGAGSARDFCVLDRINGVCRAIPEINVSQDDCLTLANYGNWEDLDRAIHHVIAGDDCLSVFETRTGDYQFWGSMPTGVAGCK